MGGIHLLLDLAVVGWGSGAALSRQGHVSGQAERAGVKEVLAGGGNVVHLQHGGRVQHILHIAGVDEELGGVDEVEDLLEALGGESLQRELHALQLLVLGEEGVEELAVGCQDPLVRWEDALVLHQHNVHVAQVRLKEALLVQSVHQTREVEGYILHQGVLSRRVVSRFFDYQLWGGRKQNNSRGLFPQENTRPALPPVPVYASQIRDNNQEAPPPT